MKTLLLVRHAKSSWDNPGMTDFERPLNERGKRDAPRMAKRLKEKEIPVNLMLTSPAKRALSTCKRIAEVLSYPEEKIKVDDKLYHASEDKMLDIIHGLKDQNDTVMIFGHNPGLTDFVNSLTNEQIMNVPTCGIVGFNFSVDSWKDVDWSNGTMLFFDYPKSKSDQD
ncbi:MAG TPA: histidine phosphatase family protein [Cyclobacteriaceae bacterium]|nr:histidine phosphatase family protein [Cyclobacteriaceae bacterium]